MTQIIASNESSGNFEIAPDGTFIGRCYSMVYMGTIPDEFQGVEKHLKKVRLMFELPTETRVFKTENGEEPYSLSKEFTLSLHEKATLRKFLEGWRGKGFTDSEAEKFDLTKLLGVPCILNIVHKTSKSGKTYAEIASASPIMKGMEVPEQVNNDFVFSILDWDEEKFKSLNEWVQNRIKSSDEYRHIIAGEPLHNDVAPPVDDDLPF